MISNLDFDAQIEEALSQELVGWDFTWFNQHTKETPLPWDYREFIRARISTVNSLLDLGTGRGEFLASLAPVPENTWATEGYPPNVTIARCLLEPLGVKVVDVSEVDDNNKLPFDPDVFDLVINRHTGYDAQEVNRVLRVGGRLITQQVGEENCMDLNRFLQEEPYFRYSNTTLAGTVQDLENAGFRIWDQREAFPTLIFLDFASVIFYLKAISWQIEDFSIDRYHDKLYQIYQIIEQKGGFKVKEHRFLVEAEKKR
jgi:SAM-dependent methyltransferase